MDRGNLSNPVKAVSPVTAAGPSAVVVDRASAPTVAAPRIIEVISRTETETTRPQASKKASLLAVAKPEAIADRLRNKPASEASSKAASTSSKSAPVAPPKASSAPPRNPTATKVGSAKPDTKAAQPRDEDTPAIAAAKMSHTGLNLSLTSSINPFRSSGSAPTPTHSTVSNSPVANLFSHSASAAGGNARTPSSSSSSSSSHRIPEELTSSSGISRTPSDVHTPKLGVPVLEESEWLQVANRGKNLGLEKQVQTMDRQLQAATQGLTRLSTEVAKNSDYVKVSKSHAIRLEARVTANHDQVLQHVSSMTGSQGGFVSITNELSADIQRVESSAHVLRNQVAADLSLVSSAVTELREETSDSLVSVTQQLSEMQSSLQQVFDNDAQAGVQHGSVLSQISELQDNADRSTAEQAEALSSIHAAIGDVWHQMRALQKGAATSQPQSLSAVSLHIGAAQAGPPTDAEHTAWKSTVDNLLAELDQVSHTLATQEPTDGGKVTSLSAALTSFIKQFYALKDEVLRLSFAQERTSSLSVHTLGERYDGAPDEPAAEEGERDKVAALQTRTDSLEQCLNIAARERQEMIAQKANQTMSLYSQFKAIHDAHDALTADVNSTDQNLDEFKATISDRLAQLHSSVLSEVRALIPSAPPTAFATADRPLTGDGGPAHPAADDRLAKMLDTCKTLVHEARDQDSSEVRLMADKLAATITGLQESYDGSLLQIRESLSVSQDAAARQASRASSEHHREQLATATSRTEAAIAATKELSTRLEESLLLSATLSAETKAQLAETQLSLTQERESRAKVEERSEQLAVQLGQCLERMEQLERGLVRKEELQRVATLDAQEALRELTTLTCQEVTSLRIQELEADLTLQREEAQTRHLEADEARKEWILSLVEQLDVKNLKKTADMITESTVAGSAASEERTRAMLSEATQSWNLTLLAGHFQLHVCTCRRLVLVLLQHIFQLKAVVRTSAPPSPSEHINTCFETLEDLYADGTRAVSAVLSDEKPQQDLARIISNMAALCEHMLRDFERLRDPTRKAEVAKRLEDFLHKAVSQNDAFLTARMTVYMYHMSSRPQHLPATSPMSMETAPRADPQAFNRHTPQYSSSSSTSHVTGSRSPGPDAYLSPTSDGQHLPAGMTGGYAGLVQPMQSLFMSDTQPRPDGQHPAASTAPRPPTIRQTGMAPSKEMLAFVKTQTYPLLQHPHQLADFDRMVREALAANPESDLRITDVIKDHVLGQLVKQASRNTRVSKQPPMSAHGNAGPGNEENGWLRWINMLKGPRDRDDHNALLAASIRSIPPLSEQVLLDGNLELVNDTLYNIIVILRLVHKYLSQGNEATTPPLSALAINGKSVVGLGLKEFFMNVILGNLNIPANYIGLLDQRATQKIDALSSEARTFDAYLDAILEFSGDDANTWAQGDKLSGGRTRLTQAPLEGLVQPPSGSSPVPGHKQQAPAVTAFFGGGNPPAHLATMEQQQMHAGQNVAFPYPTFVASPDNMPNHVPNGFVMTTQGLVQVQMQPPSGYSFAPVPQQQLVPSYALQQPMMQGMPYQPSQTNGQGHRQPDVYLHTSQQSKGDGRHSPDRYMREPAQFFQQQQAPRDTDDDDYLSEDEGDSASVFSEDGGLALLKMQRPPQQGRSKTPPPPLICWIEIERYLNSGPSRPSPCPRTCGFSHDEQLIQDAGEKQWKEAERLMDLRTQRGATSNRPDRDLSADKQRYTEKSGGGGSPGHRSPHTTPIHQGKPSRYPHGGQPASPGREPRLFGPGRLSANYVEPTDASRSASPGRQGGGN